MSETTTKPMSIAAGFRNMWGIIAEAADRSRGQNADARYAAMFEAANKAQLWLTTKSTLGALMNTCAKKDAEITKLKSQLEEARAAMQVVLDDPALQSVAGWYDSINGLRSVLDAHKEGGKS